MSQEHPCKGIATATHPSHRRAARESTPHAPGSPGSVPPVTLTGRQLSTWPE